MKYSLGKRIPTVGVFKGSNNGSMGRHNEGAYLNVIKDKTNLLKIKDSRGTNDVNIHHDILVQNNAEELVNIHQLFQGDKVLQSQVIMAVFSEVIREDRILQDRVIGSDWLNNILDNQKTALLIEIGSKVSDILGVEYDLVNHYSESLRDYLGAINDGLLTVDSKDYHINFCMLLKLMKKGFITLNSSDSGYINGTKLLYMVYDGKRESFKSVCKNSGSSRPKCVVQYFKDLANNESAYIKPTDYKVRTLTSSSLKMVSNDFSYKKGYSDIYALIHSYLS